MFRMPQGIALMADSGTSLPKAARMPRSGLNSLMIGNSSEAFWTWRISILCFWASTVIGKGLRTWACGKMRAQISICGSASRASKIGVLALMPCASCSLPKNRILVFFAIRIEVLIVLDISIVIKRFEIALVVQFIECVFLAFYVIDEKNSVEMVDFVHKSASEEVACLKSNFGAIFELRLDADFSGAGYFAINSRNRKTPLVVVLCFSFSLYYFGIKKGDESGVVFVAHVFANDDNALIVTELRRRHSGR